jgi:hypothetical protein
MWPRSCVAFLALVARLIQAMWRLCSRPWSLAAPRTPRHARTPPPPPAAAVSAVSSCPPHRALPLALTVAGGWHGQTAAFMVALKLRGETADAVAACATVLQRAAVPCALPDVYDIVGTGGDGHNTFNVSTCAAIVAAACGVRVAKARTAPRAPVCVCARPPLTARKRVSASTATGQRRPPVAVPTWWRRPARTSTWGRRTSLASWTRVASGASVCVCACVHVR